MKAKKTKRIKKSWLSRLLDMDDTSVSASTVFLLITSSVAIILLLVPAIVLIVEVVYNHTIQSDLSGMAAYIGAVCGIFASGGILKGWTNYSNYRFLNQETKEAIKKLSNVVLQKVIESIDASSLKDDEDEHIDIIDNMEEPIEDDLDNDDNNQV